MSVECGRGTPSVVHGLHPSKRGKRFVRRSHTTGRIVDLHSTRLEHRLTASVRDRAGVAAGARNVDAMVRGSGIEVGLRRPACFRELEVVPAADARDERAGRNGLRPAGDGLLQFRDREGSLDTARLITRVDTRPRVMDV